MKVEHPARGLVDIVFNDEQLVLFDALNRSRRLVVKKDRQIGASTLIVFCALLEAFSEKTSILIVEPTLIQASNLFKRFIHAIEKDTSILLKNNRLEFHNGSTIQIVSGKALKHGPRIYMKQFNTVYLDEYEWLDLNCEELDNILAGCINFAAFSSQKPGSFSFEHMTAKVLDSNNCRMQTLEKLTIFGVE